jgi:hypothetical protein
MSELLAGVISFLVVSIVVGYVFALKIQERLRIRGIGVIVVLSAFTLLIFFSILMANPSASPWYTDSLKSMFNTSGWTDYDWFAYSALWVSLSVIIALVIILIGLYAGSMLRKPSPKTKE